MPTWPAWPDVTVAELDAERALSSELEIDLDGARAELEGARRREREVVDRLAQDVRLAVSSRSDGVRHTETENDQLLTRAQAAHARGLSPRALDRLLASGALPFVRPGRHRRVRRSDLDAYIASRELAR
jgi:excisionase family DNA binding protein